jgi:uncharacterized protein
VTTERERPHLPHAAEIDAYGKGGFRFAGMSHRGSLVCLPDGIWPCRAQRPQDIDEASLALIFATTPPLDHCVIGTGRDSWFPPRELKARFAERGIAVETMATGPAVMTYNILLGERRRIAALLIAVE